jgi:hypothetical protein
MIVEGVMVSGKNGVSKARSFEESRSTSDDEDNETVQHNRRHRILALPSR